MVDKNKKSLLSYFGVDSQKELLEFVENNPTDKKVLELKELFDELNVNFSDADD